MPENPTYKKSFCQLRKKSEAKKIHIISTFSVDKKNEILYGQAIYVMLTELKMTSSKSAEYFTTLEIIQKSQELW